MMTEKLQKKIQILCIDNLKPKNMLNSRVMFFAGIPKYKKN